MWWQCSKRFVLDWTIEMNRKNGLNTVYRGINIDGARSESIAYLRHVVRR